MAILEWLAGSSDGGAKDGFLRAFEEHVSLTRLAEECQAVHRAREHGISKTVAAQRETVQQCLATGAGESRTT